MKLLLIVPNIEGRVGYPPFNLAVLKSFINQETNHNAKIIDLTFYKKNWKQHLKYEIENENPNLIGISALSFEVSQSLQIATFIKNHFSTKIIFGGVHSILSPADIIREEPVDFVCTGEGEYTLKELLDNNLNPFEIKGLTYKKNSDIISNPKQSLIENLDKLPFPDWSDYDLKRYFAINSNHLTLMVSRGCPYSCSFCSNHALKKKLEGQYVRFKSVDIIMKEIGKTIDDHQAKGFKYIHFIDDIFILDKKWTLEFCRKFKEHGYHKKVKWMVSVRANLVTEEIISALEDAGCYEVGMGIESGSEYIRNEIYKRNMSLEQIENAVKIIKRSKMLLRVQFIIGAPFETIDMMKKTLELAKNINGDVVMFSILMPLPGTDILKMFTEKDNAKSNGLKNSQMMYSMPVASSDAASKKQIKDFYSTVRNYQLKKYFLEGLKRKHIWFILDLLLFFCYYKPKYALEIQNAFKFTVKKYQIEKISKDLK